VRRRGVMYTPGKTELNEFTKWVAGVPNTVQPELVHLYNRAMVCKAFPAYTLESARHANARDVWLALEMLDVAAKVQG
jgi:hypothetical protein